MAAILLAGPARAQTSQEWTSAHHDARNSGFSVYQGPQIDAIRWVSSVPGAGSPVIGANGLVHVINYVNPQTNSWKVAILNPDGSLLRESVQTFGGFAGSPVVADDGAVFITHSEGQTSGEVICVESSGATRWVRELRSVTSSVAIGPNGVIYASTSDPLPGPAALYALDPATGATIWSSGLGAVLREPAVTPSGDVVITSHFKSGPLYSVSAHDQGNGAVVWQTELPAPIGNQDITPATIAGDGSIHIFANPSLWALNPAGQVMWSEVLDEGPHTSTVALGPDGSVRIATQGNFVTGVPARLHSLTNSGVTQWTVDFGAGPCDEPAIAVDTDGTTYVSRGSMTGCPGEDPLLAITNQGVLLWSRPGVSTYKPQLALAANNTLYTWLAEQQGVPGALHAFSDGSPSLPVIAGPIVNPANGHSYYLLDTGSWTASEATGVALGGHLATINDQGEQNWVFGTFGAWGGTSRNLFIGLNDAANEGTFEWVSGEPVTYLNWSPGEPNSGEGQVDEDHGEIFAPSDPRAGGWNDQADAAPCAPACHGVVEVPTAPPGCTVTCSASAPPNGVVGVEVQFTGEATPTGCIGTPAYSWDFGDGGNAQIQNPLYAYQQAGGWTWTMTAEVDGVECQESGEIEIAPAPPVCQINCVPTVPAEGTAGTPVSFTVEPTPGPGCVGSPTYLWTFGDGATSTDHTTSHAYDNAGTPGTPSAQTDYEWSVKVEMGPDGSCTKPGQVAVHAPPIVLVHGWCGGPNEGTWGDMPQLLENLGLTVYVANLSARVCNGPWCIYPGWSCPACPSKDIQGLAVELGKQIAAVAGPSTPKVDVLAHSMGGLVTRAYAANLAPGFPYRHDIHRVVMAGTPNYGVQSQLFLGPPPEEEAVCLFASGQQRRDMYWGSEFLWNLHRAWESVSAKPAVLSVAGDAWGSGDADGLVLVYSAAMRDTSSPVRYVPYFHSPLQGVPALAKATDSTHATLQLSEHFFKQGDPLLECCGDKELDPTVKAKGMLLMNISAIPLPPLDAFVFSPKAAWDGSRQSKDATNTWTLTGFGPKPPNGENWLGSISLVGRPPMFPSVKINAGRATLCSYPLQKDCEWP